MLEDIIYPNALCGVVIDDDLWFMNHLANALMKMKLTDGSITEWHKIEPYEIIDSTLYLDMLRFDNYIVLIPDVCSDYIVFFDINTKEQSKVRISDDLFLTKSVVINDKLILFSKFPHDNFHIVSVDVREKSLSFMHKWEDKIRAEIPKDIQNNKCIYDLAYDNHSIWLLIKNTNYLIQYNYIEDYSQCHKLDKDYFGKIAVGSDGVYLSSKYGRKLYRWDSESVEMVKDFSSNIDTNENDTFVSISNHNGIVVCLPMFGKEVNIFDENKESIYSIDLTANGNIYPLKTRREYPFYNFRCVSSDKYIVVLPNAGKDFWVINKKQNSVFSIFPKNLYDFRRAALSQMNEIMFRENSDFTLKEYLKNIVL